MFYYFNMVLIWFENMILIRSEFGVMILIWFCYIFDMVWLMDWICFWYGLGTECLFRVPNRLVSRKETETARGQAFGWFLEGFSGFDMSLLLFLYGFDTIVKVNLCFPLLSQVEPKQLRNSHFLNCKLIGCKGDHMRKWKMS